MKNVKKRKTVHKVSLHSVMYERAILHLESIMLELLKNNLTYVKIHVLIVILSEYMEKTTKLYFTNNNIILKKKKML